MEYWNACQGHHCKVIGKVRTCKTYVALLACQLLTSDHNLCKFRAPWKQSIISGMQVQRPKTFQWCIRDSSSTQKNVHGILKCLPGPSMQGNWKGSNLQTLCSSTCMSVVNFWPVFLVFFLDLWLGLFLAWSHMESNIPQTKSLALSYFFLQQHRCSVACLDLTKIASIGLSSTGSTPWWIVQHLS